MQVRLNITIDEDVHERLKREVPAKGMSRFINDAVRARLRPSDDALDDAYRAASREAWRQSEASAWEFQDVLTRKFRQREPDVRSALRLFRETFTLVDPEVLDPPVCRDVDDDVVLGTALAGGCAAIVTGDQDLLVLDPFRDIRVLAPSAFWKWESEQPEA